MKGYVYFLAPSKVPRAGNMIIEYSLAGERLRVQVLIQQTAQSQLS